MEGWAEASFAQDTRGGMKQHWRPETRGDISARLLLHTGRSSCCLTPTFRSVSTFQLKGNPLAVQLRDTRACPEHVSRGALTARVWCHHQGNCLYTHIQQHRVTLLSTLNPSLTCFSQTSPKCLLRQVFTPFLLSSHSAFHEVHPSLFCGLLFVSFLKGKIFLPRNTTNVLLSRCFCPVARCREL